MSEYQNTHVEVKEKGRKREKRRREKEQDETEKRVKSLGFKMHMKTYSRTGPQPNVLDRKKTHKMLTTFQYNVVQNVTSAGIHKIYKNGITL